MSTQDHPPFEQSTETAVAGIPLGYAAVAPTNLGPKSLDLSRSDLGQTRVAPSRIRGAKAPQSASPQSNSAAATATPRTSPPLPKRPRGRLFVALSLLLVFGGFGFVLFENFVRYGAYGEVIGRKIELATPWDGVVSDLNVRIGETVRAGDVLFRVENLQKRHRLEEIKEELNLERARLGAELSRLKWEAQRVRDKDDLGKAEYYETWSELLWEQSVFTDLQQQVDRGTKLHRQGAFADEKLTSLNSQLDGQEQRIAALSAAVESLKERAIDQQPTAPAVDDQVKPVLVKIENLQAELVRMRQVLDQGTVTCPANATVTRIHRLSGEHVGSANAVVEVLISDSTEIVLYVPQKQTMHWNVGGQVNLKVESAETELLCEIAHIGPEMQSAPRSIMRHYTADASLLPIFMRPVNATQIGPLVLGSKVCLPRFDLVSQH